LKLKEHTLRLIRGNPISVGLDIGNHSVKIVYIEHSQKGPVLKGAGIHVFTEPTLENGEIKNRDELLYAISSLIKKTDQKGKFKSVNFALSWSYGVIADRIKIKQVEGQSSDELILMEASRRSPFDVDDIQLDYKILDQEEDSENMEVLLVAAKQKMMQPFLTLIREANLDPINVDVDTFATANAYMFSAQEVDKEKVICLINIGEYVTNLTFIKHGAYHSTRDIGTGGYFFIQTLQRELEINEHDASSILKGRAHDDYDRAIINKCIENASEELSLGIDLAFSYFKSSENNLSIGKIMLCGGGACIERLPELIANRHNIDVEIADPLAHIQYDTNKFSQPVPIDVSTTLMVATGLALRQF